MIDIHCHILPNVDDGAKDLDNSLSLIEEEIKNNNQYIVLTPHQNKLNLNKHEILEKFFDFKKKVDSNVKLMLGCELYYYEGMEKDLINDKILTINNTNYVLIEFPTSTETKIAEVVYDITTLGYKPIIAHVERYSYLKNEDYDEIVKNGGLIQINSGCFNDKTYKKKIKYLLKKELVSFIASDCHDLKRRRCEFDMAKSYIKKKYKNQYTKLFDTIPEFV